MAAIARQGPRGPGKHVQVTSLATAVALVIPANGSAPIGSSTTLSDYNVALIEAEAQNVRWRDDGTSPSTTVGHVLAAGASMFYEGDLNKIQFIEVTTSAKLNITYYSTHS